MKWRELRDESLSEEAIERIAERAKRELEKMTREEWARKLLKKMASGHCSDFHNQQARDYLAGKEPPMDDGWKPTAKSDYEKRKEEK